ncbi:hypothetical protein AMURIS_01594 [Acetatifactor muris]|jgi:hypothetical protein|uniref:Uncharacterized protein n=1 Tax=Acetatifactor muris TaxID=879566 RepID=A0A2K4ZEJ8_9FIRM|nr:hypothetical protein AMURIS_01594 [Acetatifactor muris]
MREQNPELINRKIRGRYRLSIRTSKKILTVVKRAKKPL